MKRGLFITFEGSEGCGKSTQIGLLREQLEAAGQTCLLVREPGGTRAGEAIRELLQFSASSEGLKPEAELLLFAASRAQLVREKIQPALAAGTQVVADRFLDSTTVYQGFGRGLDLLDVNSVNDFAVGSCRPDVTFLLDMDAVEAHARARQRTDARPDRMEQEPADFYEKVRQGYLSLAREEPGRIRVLDATQSPEALAAEVWAEVERRMAAV